MPKPSPLEDRLLHDLLTIPSPPGHEASLQKVWASSAKHHADIVESDAYGNTWAIRQGTGEGPHLLVEAHADEIGLMVRHITDEGFLHVVPVGGSDVELLRGRRVVILGNGVLVHGVIGSIATHLRKSEGEKTPPKWPDLFIDIGCAKRDEVIQSGVNVGAVAVLDEGPLDLGDGILTGRGLDNRLGGYVLLRMLSLLQAGSPCAATVYAANCVHEEIGGPGARMTAFRLAPQLALVLDVTHATDSPGIDQREHGRVLLGGGPTVTHSPANHPALVERLVAVAAAEDIMLQHESASRTTGTDTDDIYPSRSGVPSALISIPLRYMHSPVECARWSDVEATIRLLVAFIHSLEEGETFRVQTGVPLAK